MSQKFINTNDFRKIQRFNFSKVKILAKYELKAVTSNKNILIGELVTVIMYFFFFTAGISGLTGEITLSNGQNIDYIEYAIPGIAMLLVVKMMGHTVYRSTIDKRWGLLGYKFNYGVSPGTYMLSLSVYPVLIFCVQYIILVLFGYLFNFSFGIIEVISSLLMGFVCITFWILLGLIITNAINDYRQRDLVLNIITLPLIFTAPTFYTLENAPRYIQIISQFNPLTYHVISVRSIFLGNPSFFYIILTIVATIILYIITRFIVKNTQLITKEQ